MEKFRYGLLAAELNDKREIIEILQFVGYFDPPTETDVAALREEFRDDPELGLQDKWETVEILEAPPEIVDEYQNVVYNNEDFML